MQRASIVVIRIITLSKQLPSVKKNFRQQFDFKSSKYSTGTIYHLRLNFWKKDTGFDHLDLNASDEGGVSWPAYNKTSIAEFNL